MKTIITPPRKRGERPHPFIRPPLPYFSDRLLARTRKSSAIKSILVPTDFSEAADRALDYAVPLARDMGARLRLVHVVETPAECYELAPYVRNKPVVEKATKRLYALAQVRIDEWIPADANVTVGKAYAKICEEAQRTDADLIVISTHGFTGLKHLLVGSTAERVIRHAPCSVLAVRGRGEPSEKPGFNPKRVLVPVDFSRHSNRALVYAKEIARQFKAEIVLLYVVPVHYGIGEYDQAAFSVLACDLAKMGRAKLTRLLAAKDAKDLSMRSELRHGRPATEITEAAKAANCDLIVISTHGRTGLDRVLLGSTTEEVVRHASCPVLVFRTKKSLRRK